MTSKGFFVASVNAVAGMCGKSSKNRINKFLHQKNSIQNHTKIEINKKKMLKNKKKQELLLHHPTPTGFCPQKPKKNNQIFPKNQK